MSRVSRTTLWGLATLLSTVVVAAPAQATRYHVTGQQTVITPTAQVTQFLSSHGIAVTPVGQASAANGSFTLPIARGRVAVPSLRAVLIHRGGIQFAKGSDTITLRHFVLSRTSGRAVLSARTAGGRTIRVARVSSPQVSITGKTGTLTGELVLTHAAARAIDHRLGKHLVSAGFDLGSITSTVTVA